MARRSDRQVGSGLDEAGLLARCRRFVLASDGSPHGEPSDALYLTPCGQWLRISSRAAYYQRTDAGEGELAHLLNANFARDLFYLRWHYLPPELDEHWKTGDAQHARDSGSQIRQARTESVINRLALESLLRAWASEWPDTDDPASPAKVPGETCFGQGVSFSPAIPSDKTTDSDAESMNELVHLSPSQLVVLRALVNSKTRHTQKKIVALTKQGREAGKVAMGTVKKATALLAEHGLIQYAQSGNTRGFFATEKGKKHIEVLDRPVD